MRVLLRDRMPAPWILGALLAIAVLVTATVFVSARHPGLLSEHAAECRENYRHALTANDSAIVDLQMAASSRDKGPGPLNCGTLRRSGELR
jgi:hypothetical protein